MAAPRSKFAARGAPAEEQGLRGTSALESRGRGKGVRDGSPRGGGEGGVASLAGSWLRGSRNLPTSPLAWSAQSLGAALANSTESLAGLGPPPRPGVDGSRASGNFETPKGKAPVPPLWSRPFLVSCGANLALYIILITSLAANSYWILRPSSLPLHSAHSTPAASNGVPPLELHELYENLTQKETARLLLGDSICGGGTLPELRRQLKDVVIIFNKLEDAEARNVSLFLHQVYGRIFKAVVVFGPLPVPELGIEGRVPHHWGNRSGSGNEDALLKSTSTNVGPWSFTAGSYSYLSFPKVVGMYPDAEGYLWAEENVVVNYWQLIRGDRERLWLTDMPECVRCQGFVPFDHRVSPTVFDGWSGHPNVRKRARDAFGRLLPKYRDRFLQSVNPLVNVTSFPKRMIDAFFVPRRFALPLAFDLIPIFREAGVVPEIALPTMFFSLDDPARLDFILSKADHRFEPKTWKYNAASFWDPYVTTFFYWNLAPPRERRKFVESFSTVDTCLEKLLPTTLIT